MAVVAIILSSLFTRGSCGSTARSRESANVLLVLVEHNRVIRHVPLYVNPVFYLTGSETQQPSWFSLMKSPGIDGEAPGRGAVHQLAEELLSRWRMAPQQGLMGEGLLDLAGHPVVGVNHALGHSLVDLQGLPGDQRRDVLLLIQLGAHLREVWCSRAEVRLDVLRGTFRTLSCFRVRRPPLLPAPARLLGPSVPAGVWLRV